MLHVWKVSGELFSAVPLETVNDVRSLKLHLQKLCGVPRFRQRLLHDGMFMDEGFKLDSHMDVQLVLQPYCDASQEQLEGLANACSGGMVQDVEGFLQQRVDPNLGNGRYTPLRSTL